ncbi:Hypothetical protein GbCGDNIH9_8501 [Granulibacter bethesdensis]|uniref:Uncharacterized protein n=1 Tax=Granulibacter bethesdensis TaxID=364410 RepID=A0AAC9P8C3_9PROT|nr:Hypothetical protein GbCGDNIH9_8501 [Granulibacter bethesdensis]APH62011.1 Hypothetical protein GbCGDNIH8_8501 [Granulibacter bethesdensis]
MSGKGNVGPVKAAGNGKGLHRQLCSISGLTPVNTITLGTCE